MQSRYKNFLFCRTACERLVFLVLLVCLQQQQQQSCQNMGFVDAFSTGAGSCKSDDDATRGGFLGIFPHNIPILTQRRSLVRFGARVFIDNTEVTSGAPFKLIEGEMYSLTVNSTRPFKGILLRLEDSLRQDLTGTLIASQPQVLRTQGLCITPIVGLTHLNSQNKFEVKATFDADGLDASVLTLDVTIVLNVGLIPRWAHSRFILPLALS